MIFFRKAVRTIHLWLGLAVGLIIFIVCISGSIYAFQKEIRLITQPYLTVNKESGAKKLPLSAMVAAYQERSGHKIVRLYDFVDESRSTMLLTSRENESYYAYMDPYTGRLLKEKAHDDSFFPWILKLHRTLLLPEKTGRQIIGWSVLLFIISLISGLILWFPRNLKVFKSKKGRRSRFGINTGQSGKRLTYDLHSVLGFYASSILIVLAVVGTAWTFSWVDGALYSMATFEQKKEEKKLRMENTSFEIKALDVIKSKVVQQRDDKKLFIYFFPAGDGDPLRILGTENDDRFGNSDNYFANPETGKIVKTKYDEEKNAGEKFRTMYYDIHTGSVLGIWGKALVFLAGLTGASLPVSGFLIWRGKS